MGMSEKLETIKLFYVSGEALDNNGVEKVLEALADVACANGQHATYALLQVLARLDTSAQIRQIEILVDARDAYETEDYVMFRILNLAVRAIDPKRFKIIGGSSGDGS